MSKKPSVSPVDGLPSVFLSFPQPESRAVIFHSELHLKNPTASSSAGLPGVCTVAIAATLSVKQGVGEGLGGGVGGTTSSNSSKE